MWLRNFFLLLLWFRSRKREGGRKINSKFLLRNMIFENWLVLHLHWIFVSWMERNRDVISKNRPETAIASRSAIRILPDHSSEYARYSISYLVSRKQHCWRNNKRRGYSCTLVEGQVNAKNERKPLSRRSFPGLLAEKSIERVRMCLSPGGTRITSCRFAWSKCIIVITLISILVTSPTKLWYRRIKFQTCDCVLLRVIWSALWTESSLTFHSRRSAPDHANGQKADSLCLPSPRGWKLTVLELQKLKGFRVFFSFSLDRIAC